MHNGEEDRVTRPTAITHPATRARAEGSVKDVCQVLRQDPISDPRHVFRVTAGEEFSLMATATASNPESEHSGSIPG